MAVTITSLILFLIGLALGAGGIWLASLGGSWYYIVVGLAFLIAAWLLYRRRSTALWLYAAIVLGTLAWAVWETGFDWWELGPRGGIIVLVALWLLTPWARRGLAGPDGRAPLILAVLASLAVAGYSMTTDPKDIAGALDTDKVIPKANLGGDVPAGEWHFYGRTQFGQRYSPLDQITPDNVANLQPAWTYRTGDVKGPDDIGETTYQVTPLKIGDTLYICTPHNFAIAVDAATGKEKWRYDPKIKLDKDRQHQTCRGVSYYADAGGAGQPCATRVYLPTSDARLIALDAANGQVCPAFAEAGTLNLLTGMPYPKSGYYYSTSAPLISGGKIIVGGAVNDNYSTQEPSGVIRAYDASTGKLIWNWDSGNPDQTTPLPAGQTYTANSPNMWSTPSADEKLGLLYVPLGNQTPDQLGAGRSANVEKFSSSITALDLNTGQLKWVRQTVHHDLWDMDVPAQPSLIDITKADGTIVPALVGPTKQGDLYVLDRRTGDPVIAVKEVPAPGGAIEGDKASPTQPSSDLSFNPKPLTDADMWGITMFDQLACRIAFHKLRYEGRYTPPSLQGSLIYPGNFGTFNWGGVAVDPVRQVMFGMPTYLAFTSRLIPRADVPPPGDNTKGSEQGLNRNEGAPYAVVMGPFLSPLGIPCQAPPWGYVAGVDLRTGSIAYRHRNGTIYDMTPLPLPLKVGVPGIGGPMITAGGVAFLGAAVDDYLRAYDLTSGKQLWQARLPAGGQSTPMTYTVADGRQFVVIVAGGHGSVGTKPGDYVMAYALPK